MCEKEGLSPVRRRAVAALTSAASFEDAAAKAGVRKQTLWAWLRYDRTFQQALREERRRQRTATCVAVEALLGAAVATLEKTMQDESLPPKVRVQASRATFEIAIQLYKLTALEERIAALEVFRKGRSGATEGERQKAAIAADRSA